MKFAIASAVSLAALAAVAAAGPAAAKDGPSVRIEHTVARVVVIVEDRADIAVEIEQGASGLPTVEVRRRGQDVQIDGGLRGGVFGNDSIRNCHSGPESARQPGGGASVGVRRVGTINMANAPLIVIRTPRMVDVDVRSGAVFGAVGRGATEIDLNNGGCGDWTVANVDGPLSLSLMGSGDMRAGTSRRLEANIMGSGNINAGATGGVEANIMGSGDINAVRVDGPVEANIPGSGTITVRGGAVGAVEANIMGSGEINIPGAVASIDANIMGSGDINVGSVSGPVSRSIMGSGEITIGGQAFHRERNRDRH